MIVLLISVGLGWSSDPKSPTFSAKNITFRQDAGVSITANQVRWDVKKKQADLTGEVNVTQDELSLSTQALSIQLDEYSKISSIVVTKPVVVVHKDQKAFANSARWDLSKDELKLEGDPKLVSAQGVFSGGVIFYLPSKEEIRCENGCSLSLQQPQ